MNKIKFGMKEVIAIVASTIIYFVFLWIQKQWFADDFVIFRIFDHLQVMCFTLVAAIFGPFPAVLNIAGAMMLENFVWSERIDYIIIFTWVVYGIIVGWYFDKYKVLDGEFKKLIVLDYYAVILCANVTALILLEPILRFLFDKVNIIDLINNIRSFAIGNILASGICASIILMIVSCCFARNRKENSKE